MQTLDALYTASTTKKFLVSDNVGNSYYIELQLDSSWYLCKLLVSRNGYYGADSNYIIVKGDTAIWTTL